MELYYKGDDCMDRLPIPYQGLRQINRRKFTLLGPRKGLRQISSSLCTFT